MRSFSICYSLLHLEMHLPKENAENVQSCVYSELLVNQC